MQFKRSNDYRNSAEENEYEDCEVKMKISGAKTIAEYKEIRDEKIQKWIDDNFVKGSVSWEMNGANAIKVTDRTGDSMVVQLEDID